MSIEAVNCLHCDEPFPEKYVRWHFQHRRTLTYSWLTCKKCGLGTIANWILDLKEGR